MALEIVRARPEQTQDFLRRTQREALSTLYDFRVVWHEQHCDFAALDGDNVVAAARIRIFASLAEIEQVVVEPERRRAGIGRGLLAACEDAANYYNCHKMTVLVPHRSAAQAFFQACGYHEEAVLPQHTFKLDMAVMRKFLL